MTDPRIIAMPSNPGQVEPGPFSEDELREQWNAQADELNQWESLDSSEQLAWAQTRAIAVQPADKAEGPSLADVAELCEEFGFTLDPAGGAVAVLQEMITAAITRWRTHGSVAQSAAKPVDVANLMRLVEGVDPLAPGDPEPDVEHVLRLAAIIRKVDGKHDLGAAALAEAILAHPGFSGCHDGPAAQPAPEQVDVEELLEFLDELAALPIFRRVAARIRRVAELLKGLSHA